MENTVTTMPVKDIGVAPEGVPIGGMPPMGASQGMTMPQIITIGVCLLIAVLIFCFVKDRGRKMGVCMSMFNGMFLGASFSAKGAITGMLNSPMHKVIPMGVLQAVFFGFILSMTVSMILGFVPFLNVKLNSDKLSEKLKFGEFERGKRGLLTAFVGDCTYTFILCFIFTAKNVGFTPALLPAYLSGVWVDFIIAFFISFLLGGAFTFFSKKISGIPADEGFVKHLLYKA